MLGSEQAAEQHLRSLQKFALETPFQFADLIDASQRMQALGFNAKEVIPILKDVGNAVAAAGGGQERLDRVIKALADVRAKEKLQSQEIRQFAEAGISVYKILGEETCKTTAQIQDMVEAGQISADLFLNAFHKYSQIHFGDLMAQQSRTFTGALSNIKDALLALGSVILNAAQQASVGAGTLAQANVPGVRPSGSGDGNVNVEVSFGTDTQDRLFVNGLERTAGRRKLGKTVNSLLKKGGIGN
jgi:tape measure domain-containing protein